MYLPHSLTECARYALAPVVRLHVQLVHQHPATSARSADDLQNQVTDQSALCNNGSVEWKAVSDRRQGHLYGTLQFE